MTIVVSYVRDNPNRVILEVPEDSTEHLLWGLEKGDSGGLDLPLSDERMVGFGPDGVAELLNALAALNPSDTTFAGYERRYVTVHMSSRPWYRIMETLEAVAAEHGLSLQFAGEVQRVS